MKLVNNEYDNGELNNNISFFEVDRHQGNFYRVYAQLERISKYELIVKIKNEYYVYHSTFDLTRAIISNTLFAFAHNKKLYQLPKVNKFSQELLRDSFKFISDKDIEKIVYNTPIIQNLTKEIYGLQNDLKRMLNLYRQNQHQNINYAVSLKLPKKYSLKFKPNQIKKSESPKKRSNSNNDFLNKPIGKCVYKHNKNKLSDKVLIPIFSKSYVSNRKIRKQIEKFLN
ncbi:MAG: hypothetical protein ACTSWX_00835 [Promethearchaeota archaeon]